MQFVACRGVRLEVFLPGFLHFLQTGRASIGRPREPKAPKVVSTSLSSDASPEDLFDWIILGLQGPWLLLASVENSSGASELKDQSLPLKFPSIAAYTATFQKLIGEEAKAIIFSEWEQFKAEQDSNTEQSRMFPPYLAVDVLIEVSY